MDDKKTVLIAGASGVIGEAALAHFTTLPGWGAIGLSRRAPYAPSGVTFQHLSVDLTDAEACRAAAPALAGVTHLVFTAVSEESGLAAGWRDPARMDLNLRMLQNLLEPLCEASPGFAHLTLLQGAKAYGAHVGRLAPVPAREREPRFQHANFYWLQEDYVRARSAERGFGFTIFRPCVVVGGAWGAVMNPMLALGAYAAIRREEGRPFSYPGGVLQVSEIVDADLLAEAFAWAAVSPDASGETFNVTDGDVFAWQEAWPALAEAFGVETGPDERLALASYLTERSDIWDALVAREGLQPLSLARFLGESHHYADILLRRDAQVIGRPNLLSTIKLRQAGFGACRDSEEVVVRWARELQARRLLPAR